MHRLICLACWISSAWLRGQTSNGADAIHTGAGITGLSLGRAAHSAGRFALEHAVENSPNVHMERVSSSHRLSESGAGAVHFSFSTSSIVPIENCVSTKSTKGFFELTNSATNECMKIVDSKSIDGKHHWCSHKPKHSHKCKMKHI